VVVIQANSYALILAQLKGSALEEQSFGLLLLMISWDIAGDIFLSKRMTYQSTL
jgi:hypothetical protein